jgi:hypothetical protein
MTTRRNVGRSIEQRSPMVLARNRQPSNQGPSLHYFPYRAYTAASSHKYGSSSSHLSSLIILSRHALCRHFQNPRPSRQYIHCRYTHIYCCVATKHSNELNDTRLLVTLLNAYEHLPAHDRSITRKYARKWWPSLTQLIKIANTTTPMHAQAECTKTKTACLAVESKTRWLPSRSNAPRRLWAAIAQLPVPGTLEAGSRALRRCVGICVPLLDPNPCEPASTAVSPFPRHTPPLQPHRPVHVLLQVQVRSQTI